MRRIKTGSEQKVAVRVSHMLLLPFQKQVKNINSTTEKKPSELWFNHTACLSGTGTGTWIAYVVLCRTFHTAPIQGQGPTPIGPYCSGSGPSPCPGTGHSQYDYTITVCEWTITAADFPYATATLSDTNMPSSMFTDFKVLSCTATFYERPAAQGRSHCSCSRLVRPGLLLTVS